jgi:hypothetical protein
LENQFELNLTGARATEWNSFTVELNKAGVICGVTKPTHFYGLEGTVQGFSPLKTAIMLSFPLSIFLSVKAGKQFYGNREFNKRSFFSSGWQWRTGYLHGTISKRKGGSVLVIVFCASIMTKTFHIFLFIVHFQRRYGFIVCRC